MSAKKNGFSTILYFIVVIFLISLIAFFVYPRQDRSSNSNADFITTNSPTALPEDLRSPSPTPFLFQEMTIPSLRSRSYTSSLGQLDEYQSFANYKSYLTSYDSDGFEINGLLTVPEGECPHPAIVFVHGYIPPSVYRTTEKYTDYVDYLARNGFVVFKIDLRGHGSSQGDAGGAYYSEDYVVDTLNAYAALKTADFVDSESIGLWGHSMAGNVIFRAFVAKQDVPAIVIWAGAVYTYEDMQKHRLNDNSYRPPSDDSKRRQERERLREVHGDFSAESDFWRQVIPTNYLDGVTGALQVHHAVNDSVVNIGYSRDLMDILDESNVEHSLYEYDTGGHNITGSSFTEAMQRTVEFFDEYLKD